MKKCILYLRVSTDHQDTERQRNELVTYAHALGYHIVDVLEEKETGRADDRQEFQKLLTYTRREIDAVFVWELSRLGRKTSTMIKTVEDWSAQGICLYAKKENLRSLDDDGSINSNTKLYLSIMASIAENETDTIKARMQSGKIDKLRTGKLSYSDKKVFGYDKVGGRLAVNDGEAETVRKIFGMRSEGHSLRVIALAVGFTINRVERVLHREAYIGKARNRLVPGEVFSVPPIVDTELWNRCQDLRRADRPGAVFAPLRKKITCPVCGRKFSLQRSVARDRRMYVCSSLSGIGAPHHPKYSSSINFRDMNEAVEKAVESWRAGRGTSRPRFEDPDNLAGWIAALEKQLQEKSRARELTLKKYEAVSPWLTETERRAELKNLASQADEIERISSEADMARVRRDNSIALKSAVFLPGEKEPWHELVRNVRMLSWDSSGRTFEVETVTGDRLEVYLKTRRGPGRK